MNGGYHAQWLYLPFTPFLCSRNLDQSCDLELQLYTLTLLFCKLICVILYLSRTTRVYWAVKLEYELAQKYVEKTKSGESV